jgi:Tfp pilus assembly protein PilO
MSKDSWIILGIVVVLVAVATGVVYWPQAQRLDELREQMAQREQTLTVSAEKVSVVPTMLREVEALKARYKGWERRLPKRKELGEFLKEISGYMAEHDLTNQSIEPGSPTRERLFHRFPIIIRFEGDYMQTAAFLKRLDGMQRLTRIQRLRVSRPRSSDKERTDDLKVEMQLNIYFTES